MTETVKAYQNFMNEVYRVAENIISQLSTKNRATINQFEFWDESGNIQKLFAMNKDTGEIIAMSDEDYFLSWEDIICRIMEM